MKEGSIGKRRFAGPSAGSFELRTPSSWPRLGVDVSVEDRGSFGEGPCSAMVPPPFAGSLRLAFRRTRGRDCEKKRKKKRGQKKRQKTQAASPLLNYFRPRQKHLTLLFACALLVPRDRIVERTNESVRYIFRPQETGWK